MRLKEMLNPEGCVAVHLIEGKENLYAALKYVYSKVFELVRVSSVEGLASKVLFAKDCSVCFIRTYSIHDKHNLGFKTSTSLNSQQTHHFQEFSVGTSMLCDGKVVRRSRTSLAWRARGTFGDLLGERFGRKKLVLPSSLSNS